MITDRYAAILFDFDGTLVDSWPGIQSAFIQGYRYFYPAGDIGHIYSLKNDNREYKAQVKFVMRVQDDHLPAEQIIQNIYLSELATKAKLFPGVQATLETLNQRRKPWGIVTTKKRQFVQEIMKIFPILNTPILICADDVIERKPSPEGLFKATIQLGITHNNVLYVGDLESDAIAAYRANYNFACALYGYNDNREALISWRSSYYLNQIDELIR